MTSCVVHEHPASTERCPNGWRCTIGCACHRLSEEERKADLANHYHLATYYDGCRHALHRFAWWKDGIEYVGSTGYTLSQAFADVDAAEREGGSYAL